MKPEMRQEYLEDVLDAYLEASSNPDYATLMAWIEQYPEYAEELTEFTIARNMMNALPEPEVSEQEEAELIAYGKSVIQSIFGTGQSKQEIVIPNSLLEAGKAIGLKPAEIAKQGRLSTALVRQLDRRLIAFASIPSGVIEQVAEVLKLQVEAIKAYLQQGPVLAEGVSYRADQAPQLAELEDFFVALEDDLSISPEDREHWLQMRPKV